MTSHVGLLLLFAAFVSIVFATIMRDEPREQLALAGRLFGGFVAAGVVLGWLLLPFPL
ncbi:MAG: hypothetical protein ACRD26_08650 [Vicinamibacterales bacterium]